MKTKEIRISRKSCWVILHVGDEEFSRNAKQWQISKKVHYKLFKELEAFFVQMGGTVDYHHTGKDFPVLKNAHRHANYKGLECHMELENQGVKWEFYQNVTKGENPNGGEYDFDKQKYMTYLMRKRLQLVMKKLVEYLQYKFPGVEVVNVDRSFKSADEYILKDYRDSWHHTPVESLQDIIDGKDKHDGRNYSYNNQDSDKKTIHNGDIKWFYRGKYLCRGQVFHNLNNMWWVKLNDIEVHNVAAFNLFDYAGQPIKKDTRDKQLRVLNEKMQCAISRGDMKAARGYNVTIARLLEEQVTLKKGGNK